MIKQKKIRLSNTSNHTSLLASVYCGNGNPFQCSCLGNPMERGAWGLQFVGSQRVGHDWATNTHWGYMLFGNTVMKFTVLTDQKGKLC